MADKTLNKICYYCSKVSMGCKVAFREYFKTKDGKDQFEERYSCDSCRSDFKKRCIKTIMDIFPRAHRESMLHELKENK